MNREKIINPITIFLAIIEIIFLIFAIITIKNILNADSKTDAKMNFANLSELESSGLDSSAITFLEKKVYAIVADNSDENINVDSMELTIRENSLIKLDFDSLGVKYLNFIVDIPEAQQSYQVVREWSESGQSVDPTFSSVVMCLPDSKAIYEDFDCQDDYDQLGAQEIIYNKIRQFSFKLEDNDDIWVVNANDDKTDEKHFEISVRTCSGQCYQVCDNTKRAEALSKFEQFVAKLGFETNQISYGLSTTCQ